MSIKLGILSNQKEPLPPDPNLAIYGVDGLPTDAQYTTTIVRTNDSIGMSEEDFNNVFPLNEMTTENVPYFLEIRSNQSTLKNTFATKEDMVNSFANRQSYYYELYNNLKHLEGIGIVERARIYVPNPNSVYGYVEMGIREIELNGENVNADFGKCVVWPGDEIDDVISNGGYDDLENGIYPVFNVTTFVALFAIKGYLEKKPDGIIFHESATNHFISTYLLTQLLTPNYYTTYKTLNDGKYWKYYSGLTGTISDFVEANVPTTPCIKVPKFYVKREQRGNFWSEKISKTQHDETWLCHKAFIGDDDLEKPYFYVVKEKMNGYINVFEDGLGNFKMFNIDQFDALETINRIVKCSFLYKENPSASIGGVDYEDAVFKGIETSPATYPNLFINTTFKNVDGSEVDMIPNIWFSSTAKRIEINENSMFDIKEILGSPDEFVHLFEMSVYDIYGQSRYFSQNIDVIGFLTSNAMSGTYTDLGRMFANGTVWPIVSSLVGQDLSFKKTRFNFAYNPNYMVKSKAQEEEITTYGLVDSTYSLTIFYYILRSFSKAFLRCSSFYHLGISDDQRVFSKRQTLMTLLP